MTNRMKWVVGIVAVILIGLAIYYSNNTKHARLGAEPIKIGVAVAKTGVGAEWGTDELRALQLAFDAKNAEGGISGRHIEMIAEDTKSDNVGTANAFSKLINVDKVTLIIGPTWGDSFQAGYALAKKAGMPVVGPSVAVEVLDRSLVGDHFVTWWPEAPEMSTVADWMIASGNDQVVQFYDHDAFNTKISEIFTAVATQKGVTILDKVVLPIGNNDFRTPLAKVLSKKPDVFFVELQDVGSFGPFLRQLRELGSTAKVVSTATSQNQQLLENFASLVENSIVYSYPAINEDASYTSLVAAYEKKYGVKPSGPSFVNAYNAGLATIAALEDHTKTDVTITEALKRVQIPGVGIEKISFGATGQVEQANFRMKTVKNGQFVNLE